jgi:hypothetical protein
MYADNTAELVEAEVKILKALSGFSNVRIYTRKVAEVADIGDQLALYHLVELEKAGYVQGNGKERDEAAWELAHDGRGYLVKHGLLA